MRESTKAHKAPSLHLDQRRVIGWPEEVSARLPRYVGALERWGLRSVADVTTLFVVANLVAYYLARVGESVRADALLYSEIVCARAILPPQDRALALDAFVNRIRLAAMNVGPQAVLAIIDLLLDSAGVEETDARGLAFGLTDMNGSDATMLRSFLRCEREILLLTVGPDEADEYDEDEFSKVHDRTLELVRAEASMRRQIRKRPDQSFHLRPNDTLRRATYRALVYIDEGGEASTELLSQVLRCGLTRIQEMSFVCPSTPRLWARTAHKWAADAGADILSLAGEVRLRAEHDATAVSLGNLTRLLGAPSARGRLGSIPESADRLQLLIDRFSEREGQTLC